MGLLFRPQTITQTPPQQCNGLVGEHFIFRHISRQATCTRGAPIAAIVASPLINCGKGEGVASTIR
jgi:hypothetical protein